MPFIVDCFELNEVDNKTSLKLYLLVGIVNRIAHLKCNPIPSAGEKAEATEGGSAKNDKTESDEQSSAVAVHSSVALHGEQSKCNQPTPHPSNHR